jgi:hypothetical protein
MDQEVAEWLADLIQQTTAALEHRPGLTIEVDDDPANWVQVIPASALVDRGLLGFILNLPFRAATDDPLTYLTAAGINLPPDSEITSWERDSHLTLWIRPDTPLVELALLVMDLLQRIGKAADDFEINVQVLHGL